MADRNDDKRFPLFGRIDGGAKDVWIEIAYPASAKSQLGGSKADVLGGDSDVDVGGIVLVVAAVPSLGAIAKDDDSSRRLTNPVAVVAVPELRECVLLGDDHKLPRLAVASRRSKACALKHAKYMLLIDRLLRIVTTRETMGG